jgi:ferritin-like metal-binding protein YciE
MSIETLQDSFIHELSDMNNAEMQITKALPKMAKAATNAKLIQAFETHLKETEQQIKMIQKVVKLSKIKLKREKCDAMEGLIKEGKQIIKEVKAGPVRDTMLIAAAQKVEHYEIASYGCLAATAKLLGFSEAAEILEEILNQEKQTDQKLNELAEKDVNKDALEQAGTSPKGKTMTNNNRGKQSNGKGRSSSSRSLRGGNNMQERNDEGQFMSENDDSRENGRRNGNRSRSRDNYDDNHSYSQSSQNNDDYEDDYYDNRSNQNDYDDDRSSGNEDYDGRFYRSGDRREEGRGRNYDRRDDSRYSRSSGRSGGESRGWFGDSEGPAEAGRHSHDNDRDRGRFSSGARGNRLSSSSRSGRDSNDNRSSRGRSSGQGWFGDSEGHARAGRHSHDNDRGRSSSGRR